MKIVHVSDLHLEPAGREQYPGLFSRLTKIRHQIAGMAPDLVVVTGDLTNLGTSVPDHFQLARDWLEELGTAYLAVPGNHDLGANPERGVLSPEMERFEDAPFSLTGYGRAFGGRPVTRAASEGLTVLTVALREGDRDGALDLLEDALSREDGPVAVAGHYPVVPTRTVTSVPAFGADGFVDREVVRLRDLLRSRDNVVAYLCGHVHLTSMRGISDQCAQFTAGGLGPGAAAFRVHEWDGRVWSYSTTDVEGPDTFWEPGLAEAREDPWFSSGSPEEREGRWVPRRSASNPVTGPVQSSDEPRT